jgi:hypothetical protein
MRHSFIIKLFHVVIVAVLLTSAVYAYSIKYETISQLEQSAKLKNKIKRERESVAVLKAEWQRFNRPERLQELASRGLDLQPLSVFQIDKAANLPNRQPKSDEIGRKLEMLMSGTETPVGSISNKTTQWGQAPNTSKTPSNKISPQSVVKKTSKPLDIPQAKNTPKSVSKEKQLKQAVKPSAAKPASVPNGL